MSQRYFIRIEKDELVFSAGHFITFDGNVCERLHGHNYRVMAEVEGPLDENAYVIDFIKFRDALIEIVGRLDHHMLLPTRHKHIQVVASDDEVVVEFYERRWVFPRGDCVLLDVPNTTTEMLAHHIGQRLLDEFRSRGLALPTRLLVGVDENFGQWGFWEQRA